MSKNLLSTGNNTEPMAYGAKIIETIESDYSRVVSNFDTHIRISDWQVFFSDNYILNDRKKIQEYFGITNAFSASTISSFMLHGARYVPFFVRIKELNNKETEISIFTGGSQDLFGFDFGRNEKVAEQALEFCTNPIKK